MKLCLGVLDLPYADGKASTGDVAQILEDRYHVMELFAEEVGSDAIANALAESAKDALADLVSGGSSNGVSLTQAATDEIEAAFRIFIDQQELDGVVPGVPTMASTGGYVDVKVTDKAGNVKTKRRYRGAVNHRLARPYAKDNPQRPSFRDTGLYQASMKVWSDD